MLRTGIARLLIPVMLLTMLLSAPMTAGAASIKITGLTVVGTPAVGNTMTWTPNVTGGSGNYTFIYTLYKTTPSGSGYDYLPKTPGSYSITFTETGTYYLQVVAQDTKYNYVSAAFVSKPIVVVGSGPRLSGDIIPNATLVPIDSTVQWTVYGETGEVGASGTTGNVTYEYSLYFNSTDLLINTVRSQPIFAYTLKQPGSYMLAVRATDEVGTTIWYNTGYLVVAYAHPVVMDSLTVSSALIDLGQSVTVKATATGGYKDLHYYWKVYRGASVIDSFDTDESTITYKPTASGIYHFSCEVRDQSSQTTGEVTTVDVTVSIPDPFDIDSITRTSTTGVTGKAISWKIKLVGGIGTKTVIYSIRQNGTVIYTSSATTTGSSVTAIFVPDQPGLYTIEAYGIDSESTYTLTNPASNTNPIVVYDGSSLYLSDLAPSVTKLTKGATVTWTYKFHNNKGGVKTSYTIYCSGTPVYSGSTTGKIIQYKIPNKAFGVYTIELSSEDVVTHKTCSLSGGAIDYSYSGPLTVTSLVPVKATLDAPGTAEWIYTLGGNPMGTIQTSYTVIDSLSNVVASGTTSAYTFSVYLSKGGTYKVTLVCTDDTGRTVTYTGGDVTVNASSSTNMIITNLKAVSTEVTASSPVTWTFGVKNVTGTWSAAYKIMFTPAGTTTTVELTGGNVTSPSITDSFTGLGKYYVKVQGKDDLGTTVWYESDVVTVKAAPNNALYVSVPTPNKASCKVGETITWTFSVNNPIGSYMVFYAVYEADKIMKMSSASDDSPISYVPNNPGYYSLRIYAMDSTATKCAPKESSETKVTQDTPSISSLLISVPTVSKTHVTSPQLVTWSFTVSSLTDDYIVSYQVYKVNGASTTLMIDNVTHKSSFSVYLDETGNYYATVQAKMLDGSSVVSQVEQSEYVVCNLPEELIEVVTPDLEPAFDPEISLPDFPAIPEIEGD